MRIAEELSERHGITIPYPTLTWLLRRWDLRTPRRKRAGEYIFGPGEEMQHDTSPHTVKIGGKKTSTQCAALVLGDSRMIFIQYFPRYRRFECQFFLQTALEFFGGSCSRCVIDNTSVIVARGVGPNAEFAPSMVYFGNYYGFKFMAHRLGDPNRKGKIERPFHYIENNFLVGRTFESWEDLNRQAHAWCVDKANAKYKKTLGGTPREAFVTERRHLNPLPGVALPIYITKVRTVDTEGYVNLDTNRYSVPEKYIGESVDVLKYWDKVQVYQGQRKLAEHKIAIYSREKRLTKPSHHQGFSKKDIYKETSAEERSLTGMNETLDLYVKRLKEQSHGRGTVKLRRLQDLKRTYPSEAFYEALSTALHYGLYDLSRLETLILKNIKGDFFELE